MKMSFSLISLSSHPADPIPTSATLAIRGPVSLALLRAIFMLDQEISERDNGGGKIRLGSKSDIVSMMSGPSYLTS